MSLSPAQISVLAADILVNTKVIPFGPLTGMQVKDVPPSQDNAVEVAKFYSQPATPNWFVWRNDVSRSEVYNNTPFDVDGTTLLSWDWTTYKNQTVAEQNAWVQMFMGDQCNMGAMNNRRAVLAIFGTAAAGNAQRAHVFGVSRRPALWIEKLFSLQITGAPANTGNDNVANNRGTATNPDLLVVIGALLASDVARAWGI